MNALYQQRTNLADVIGFRNRTLENGESENSIKGGMGLFYQAQEEAARRIAQRLHDESAQMLAMVYLQLADIASDSPDSTVRKIDCVVKQLDGVCEQLRGISHELSPTILEQLGLMPALQSLAIGIEKRTGLKLMVVGSVLKLPLIIETVIYRVVQEALSNVVRHAAASRAEVRLIVNKKTVTCTVTDDGTGLMTTDGREVRARGLGLVGIHERVSSLKGRCTIASHPNQGMELKVQIPL